MELHMRMLEEFKAFAIKGNVIDLAVGVVVGGAFGTIVKSLVDDVLMPPIGLVIGNVDFSNLFVVLHEGRRQAGPYVSLAAAKSAGAVTLNLGLFINALVSFLIVAVAIFMVLKGVNHLRQQMNNSQPEAVPGRTCPRCYSAIHLQATRCPHCTSELPRAD
jgi:large conductance mechanosensitive channel